MGLMKMTTKNLAYFNKVCDKVEASHDSILQMKSDIEYIRKALEGNGHKGLIEETTDLRTFVDGLKAQFDLSKFVVGGGLLFSIIALALTLYTIFG